MTKIEDDISPWPWHIHAELYEASISDSEYHKIADVKHYGDKRMENVFLMAAAPQLWNALYLARNAMRFSGTDFSAEIESATEALKLARPGNWMIKEENEESNALHVERQVRRTE